MTVLIGCCLHNDKIYTIGSNGDLTNEVDYIGASQMGIH